MQLLTKRDKDGNLYFNIRDFASVCDTCLASPRIREDYFCPHHLDNISELRSVRGCRILKVFAHLYLFYMHTRVCVSDGISSCASVVYSQMVLLHESSKNLLFYIYIYMHMRVHA